MQFVTGYYVDAKDGIPANIAPNRHGPALPHADLIVDAVDRRESPALIIGQLPDGVETPEALTKITKAQHTKLLTSYQAWRDELEQQQIEKEKLARVAEIEARLLELDAFSARPMRAIINGTATEDDRLILDGYEKEAATLRAEREVLNGD